MTAHHFFAPDVGGDVVELTGEEAHHAARALRVRTGETITVGDGRGTVVTGVVHGEPTARAVLVEVRERVVRERPRPRVRVFPAVAKAGKLELVVQTLTEVGVDRISPWFSARSVVRWDAAKRSAQADRLRAVALAAAKQSRRAWLPIIDEPGELEDPPTPTIVFHEGARAGVADALAGAPDPEEVGVIVGPEGGLDDAEREALRARGAREAVLTETILRSETAALVGAVLVMNAYRLVG